MWELIHKEGTTLKWNDPRTHAKTTGTPLPGHSLTHSSLLHFPPPQMQLGQSSLTSQSENGTKNKNSWPQVGQNPLLEHLVGSAYRIDWCLVSLCDVNEHDFICVVCHVQRVLVGGWVNMVGLRCLGTMVAVGVYGR